jgi:TPR repeat protein
MEFQGLGMPKDETAGMAHIKQAADAQNMEATGLHGTMLQLGVGVPKDETAGAQMLKIAAESHDPEAEQAYAIALFNGAGVPKDDAQGVYLQKRAADDGNDQAAAHGDVDAIAALKEPELVAAAAAIGKRCN